MNKQEEKDVINHFIGQYGQCRNMFLKVTDWPDEKKGSIREIDAVIERKPVSVAIEHTRVYCLKDQCLDDAQFSEVFFNKIFGGVIEELEGKYEGRILVDIEPNTIKTNNNPEAQKNAFVDWFLKVVPSLPYSKPSPSWSDWRTDTKFSFRVHVYKWQSAVPDLRITLSAANRVCPEDYFELISNKLTKLEPYKQKGYHTILLVENDDISCMDRDEMDRILLPALEHYSGVQADEVWYVDTSPPPEYWYYYPICSNETGVVHRGQILYGD